MGALFNNSSRTHTENGKLKQRPLKALETLRTNKETALGYANKFNRKLHPYEGKQYEMIIDILENDAEVYFELRSSRNESTLIIYNQRENTITLDRSDSGLLPTKCRRTARTTRLDTPLNQLHIFVDTSSIEIFCNDGVLTSRIFPGKCDRYQSIHRIRTSLFTIYEIRIKEIIRYQRRNPAFTSNRRKAGFHYVY